MEGGNQPFVPVSCPTIYECVVDVEDVVELVRAGAPYDAFGDGPQAARAEIADIVLVTIPPICGERREGVEPLGLDVGNVALYH